MKVFEKVISFLVSALFVLFLLTVTGYTVYKNLAEEQTYSYFENRNLAAFPEPGRETVLDGSFFDGFEDWCRDHIAGRTTVVRYDTLLNLYVLRRPVVNRIVVLDDLLLPYNEPETVDYDKISKNSVKMADRLRSHADMTESYGGHFYYVAVPCQYVCFEDRYPFYMNNRAEYTKASSEALFRELEARDISYLDMRQVFKQQGTMKKFSSTVDNHYSIFGAFETYRNLMEMINRDTGYDLPILTENDYTVQKVPQPYLGSRNRKLLGLWETDEALYTITPNVSVPFVKYDWGNEKPAASKVYSLPKADAEKVLYSVYMGGDISITRLQTSRPELPSILIYGDSFTNAAECIIWYNFNSMTSLDLRHYKDMTLNAFIEAEKPDVVVCIRDYESLLDFNGNGQ